MAITTLDGYIASGKQKVPFTKTTAVTTVAAQWFSTLDVAGVPSAGSLAVGNTANGLVPTDATTGYPVLNNFGSNTGYISSVEFSNTVASRLYLVDRLFNVGSISATALATTTLTSQPSYSARLPNADYKGLEIWIEVNVAFSATATTVAVGYTNQDGTTGRTTGASASLTGVTTRRMIQLPLQAGDSGVQAINSVTVGGTVATAGTFNILVVRPLWQGRVRSANDGDIHGLDKTGLPIIYETSALMLMIAADSTSGGIPDVVVEVCNG